MDDSAPRCAHIRTGDKSPRQFKPLAHKRRVYILPAHYYDYPAATPGTCHAVAHVAAKLTTNDITGDKKTMNNNNKESITGIEPTNTLSNMQLVGVAIVNNAKPLLEVCADILDMVGGSDILDGKNVPTFTYETPGGDTKTHKYRARQTANAIRQTLKHHEHVVGAVNVSKELQATALDNVERIMAKYGMIAEEEPTPTPAPAKKDTPKKNGGK